MAAVKGSTEGRKRHNWKRQRTSSKKKTITQGIKENLMHMLYVIEEPKRIDNSIKKELTDEITRS